MKGVRSQVEISKVKEEEKVEEDIHGVAEEANEVVPKKDMVTLTPCSRPCRLCEGFRRVKCEYGENLRNSF